MTLLDALPIGVLVLDPGRRILGWNRWLEEHTGIESGRAIGHALGDLFPGMANRRFDMAVEQALHRGGPQILSQALHHHLIPIELPNLARHGFDLMRQQVHIEAHGEDDAAVVVVSIIDVTGGVLRTAALTDIAQRLEDDVNHDSLTRLFNRRFVEAWLEHQHKQVVRYDYSIAALMVDVDHFKEINDRHGHMIGDQVLREFAGLVTESVRESDVVARLGGDEFLILLPRCDQELATDVADRIVRATREASLAALPVGAVTCSVGMALSEPACPVAPSDLMRESDRRLYLAKTGGRDRVVSAG